MARVFLPDPPIPSYHGDMRALLTMVVMLCLIAQLLMVMTEDASPLPWGQAEPASQLARVNPEVAPAGAAPASAEDL